MNLNLENGWFYSITERPFKSGEGKYVLRIYYKKVLKHQDNMSYRAGDRTIQNIIEKIKK